MNPKYDSLYGLLVLNIAINSLTNYFSLSDYIQFLKVPIEKFFWGNLWQQWVQLNFWISICELWRLTFEWRKIWATKMLHLVLAKRLLFVLVAAENVYVNSYLERTHSYFEITICQWLRLDDIVRHKGFCEWYTRICQNNVHFSLQIIVYDGIFNRRNAHYWTQQNVFWTKLLDIHITLVLTYG